MKTYREIALQYKYGISEDMSDRIIASININNDRYSIDELCFLSRLNIPIFEYRIGTPKELDKFLNKIGKSVYMDYLTHTISNMWSSFINKF